MVHSFPGSARDPERECVAKGVESAQEMGWEEEKKRGLEGDVVEEFTMHKLSKSWRDES